MSGLVLMLMLVLLAQVEPEPKRHECCRCQEDRRTCGSSTWLECNRISAVMKAAASGKATLDIEKSWLRRSNGTAMLPS